MAQAGGSIQEVFRETPPGFLSEFRAAHPELTMCEQSTQASAQWKAIGMQQKELYNREGVAGVHGRNEQVQS